MQHHRARASADRPAFERCGGARSRSRAWCGSSSTKAQPASSAGARPRASTASATSSLRRMRSLAPTPRRPAGSGYTQPASAVGSSPKSDDNSPFSRARINSIVFRLIGPREFVDRRQNSIVPLSNEFLLQVIETHNGYMLPWRRFHCKSVIFVVLAPLAASAGVASSARMAHETGEAAVLAWRCAGIVGAAHHQGRKRQRRQPDRRQAAELTRTAWSPRARRGVCSAQVSC